MSELKIKVYSFLNQIFIYKTVILFIKANQLVTISYLLEEDAQYTKIGRKSCDLSHA